MKTVKGTKQKAVRVVEYRPFAKVIIFLIIVLLLAVASAGSYYYGRSSALIGQEKPKLEIDRLSQSLAKSEESLREAQQKLMNIELGAEVDRTASESVRKEMTELRTEIARLQEDNGFYRNLMAPTDEAKGLQVGSLELARAGQDRRFSYRVVIQQLVSRHELLNGHLLVRIVGKQDGVSRQYALNDLSSQVKSEKIKLRFKYFQNIEGDAKGGHTLFDSEVEIDGNVKFSGTLDIEGTVNGDVLASSDSDALIRVRENGCVNGDIRAPKIVINGRINGDVYSLEHLELASEAEVNGNVHYQQIEMVKGAHVNGVAQS